jgi:hypothetical protein
MKLSTKNYYFSKHILFSIIYLLQEQKLNPRNYSKQEIIMNIFVEDTIYKVYMYAKFRCLGAYRFL